jgi:hypothetical protein
MKDLTIILENRPAALAELGETLGRADISIEGGGVFVVDGRGVAHFLFADGDRARGAIEATGLRVEAAREVLTARLRQAEPGQLGKLTRLLAVAGVNIEVIYTDHEHQLVLVVDDVTAGQKVCERWALDAGHEPSAVAR